MQQFAGAGSSANPPHLEHRMLMQDASSDARNFTSLFWIPCGERSDKHFAVCPSCMVVPRVCCHECVNHRIAMTEMTVGDLRLSSRLPNFQIWYDDIFASNTPTIKWLEKLGKLYPYAKLTWITGSDSVIPRAEFGGKNEIQARWQSGEKLWTCKKWNWLIYNRPGHHLPPGVCLPKNFQLTSCHKLTGLSSSSIRKMIAAGNPGWGKMVMPKVEKYIMQNRLYGYKP